MMKKKNNVYCLRFECGAVLPEKGYFERSINILADKSGIKLRKEDNRYRWLVFDSFNLDFSRPKMMRNNNYAPCNLCPCKDESGMKKFNCYVTDGDGAILNINKELFIITCYPEEIKLGTIYSEDKNE